MKEGDDAAAAMTKKCASEVLEKARGVEIQSPKWRDRPLLYGRRQRMHVEVIR